VEIRDDLSLELGLRSSGVFGTEGDPRCSNGGVTGWSIFGMEGGFREDLVWRMLLDGLNDVKVSKGVLGCLDTRHYLDEGQFWNGIHGIGIQEVQIGVLLSL